MASLLLWISTLISLIRPQYAFLFPHPHFRKSTNIHPYLRKASKDSKPNFIFILTDDQDLLFDSVSVMPSLLSNIRDSGMTFTNGFVATPICCPSRTETITGRFFHNIRAADNSLNSCMHIAAQYNVIHSKSNMFAILQSHGYATGAFGKLTNDQNAFWCVTPPIIGPFNRVNAPCAEAYYETQYFDLYLNGTHHLHHVPEGPYSNYLTSFVGNQSVQWIEEMITDHRDQPFLAWIGVHAPHGPATPAVWYANRFNQSKAPRTPNYNIQSKDKVDWIATNPELYGDAVDNIDQQWRDRLRTLLSVDDLIEELFILLRGHPTVLDNTYVVFTSDHGFHLGQWRVGLTKHLPYDTDMRVPLFITGPGIRSNSSSDIVIGNIDFVPTFLGLAGIDKADDYDGIDWSSYLLKGNHDDDDGNDGDTVKREAFLSEYISIGTKCINGCPAWYPGINGSFYPGRAKSAPCYNDHGEAWMMDESETGNWRALRILNETTNVMYVEWYYMESKEAWNASVWEEPYWIELYNVDIDPYQMHNLWKEQPDQGEYYRSMLKQYGECAGSNCHLF